MFAVIVAVAAVGSSGLAQDRSGSVTPTDKYMISAKAGGVNFVEGDVTVFRKHGRSGPLLRRDQLEIGDLVSTGSTGKAEILLNPGSFLRLGSNSKFAFTTTDLDDLQIALTSGSAIFEVFANDNFTVSVFTPKESLTLVETGVYRIDLLGDGTGSISVIEGKAEVGDYPATIVKKGRTTSLGTTNATVAKFDRGKRDELAEWSRTRGKDLAKMSSSLRNRDVRNTLASTYRNGRWNVYQSFGLWVYNPFLSAYCFLPFGQYWDSPYGFGYGQGFGWYNFPPIYYYPPPVNRDQTRVATAPTGEMPVDPITRPKPTEESFRIASPPPFTQLERRRGDGVREFDPFGTPHRDNAGTTNMPGSSPVYVPQTARAPEVPTAPKKRDTSPIDH